VHLNYAMRRRTAKMASPCDKTTIHGKEKAHGKHSFERTAKRHARQRCNRAHGKDRTHAKDVIQCTAKKQGTAKAHAFAVHTIYAVHHDDKHGKEAFAVYSTLCRMQNSFFKKKSFLFYSF
jgi:hypothetical protein